MSAELLPVTQIRTERDIEDAIAREPWLLYPDLDERGWKRSDLRVHRQVYVDTVGSIDLLIVHPAGLSVVEVKRDSIGDTAVGQALRYASALALGFAKMRFGHYRRNIGCAYEFAIDVRLVGQMVTANQVWSSHARELAQVVTVDGRLVRSGPEIHFFGWCDGGVVRLHDPADDWDERYTDMEPVVRMIATSAADIWKPRETKLLTSLRPRLVRWRIANGVGCSIAFPRRGRGYATALVQRITNRKIAQGANGG